MSERIPIPGSRDVRAVRDGPAEAETIVVACPPHPQLGGSRTDSRLTAVADALAKRSIATLRFDYGPWDEGAGEVTDAVAACRWAVDSYERIGLFGYSFGGGVAILAATESEPHAVSVLAPAATVGDRDAVAAVDNIDVPLQVVYGERDDTVDWEGVVDAARTAGEAVDGVGADHFFVGQRGAIAEVAATWLAEQLAGDGTPTDDP